MLEKIEHIGIAVKDLEKSEALFNALLNQTPYKREVVESESVQTVFYQSGPNKIELLQALAPESAIAKYIDKKGEGIHHIAFAVDDIVAELARLKDAGFQLIHETPKEGADGKLIAFLHPKDTNGVLIELCMDKNK
ncbi:MAG: methylmalonyl-CoA epimerase [Bacteroidia bacterium]|nr:methylmalonyl-CoA epimerase [Bacteroidia bacterium]MCF8427760.1 methylmalonyl-CoA epimerase [Bacteroidia bacterium]MCF8447482.1 methylmalonyl-CoA epimerase [Bacteroidia bacterium]